MISMYAIGLLHNISLKVDIMPFLSELLPIEDSLFVPLSGLRIAAFFVSKQCGAFPREQNKNKNKKRDCFVAGLSCINESPSLCKQQPHLSLVQPKTDERSENTVPMR